MKIKQSDLSIEEVCDFIGDVEIIKDILRVPRTEPVLIGESDAGNLYIDHENEFFYENEKTKERYIVKGNVELYLKEQGII